MPRAPGTPGSQGSRLVAHGAGGGRISATGKLVNLVLLYPPQTICFHLKMGTCLETILALVLYEEQVLQHTFSLSRVRFSMGAGFALSALLVVVRHGLH